MKYDLFRLAKYLSTRLFSELKQIPSEIAYCYEHLAIINAKLGCMLEAGEAALNVIMTSTDSPANAEIRLIASRAYFLQNRKEVCLKQALQV